MIYTINHCLHYTEERRTFFHWQSTNTNPNPNPYPTPSAKIEKTLKRREQTLNTRYLKVCRDSMLKDLTVILIKKHLENLELNPHCIHIVL